MGAIGSNWRRRSARPRGGARGAAALAVVGGFLAAALWLFTARPAAAVPTYAARTGFTCITCHFDPNGGGPRKEMGFVFARQRHDLAPDPSPHWRSLGELTNRLGDWFYFGTNTRGYYLYDKVLGPESRRPKPISTFFQMQSAVYATVRPHPHLLLTWSLDFNEFSQSQTRDAYGMIDGLPQGLYVRAGRVRNPFGLRQDDHTAGTRYGFLAPPADVGGALPYDPRIPQTGLEVGAAPGIMFGALAVLNGDAAFANDVHAVALKWGLARRPFQVAVSGYDSYLSSLHARNTRWGAYGLCGWRDLSVVVEAVAGQDRAASGALTRVAGVTAAADYRFTRWFLLSARYDFADRNRTATGFAAQRFGGDAVFTPVPFSDLRLSFRRIAPERAPNENQYMAMWHFYY